MSAVVDEPGPRRVTPVGRDSDVLRLAAAGDRAAQQELLLAFIDRIRGRVHRLVGASSENDDLVQQACVELLRSLRRFRGDASLRLWVDRITANVVYKHLRTTKRRRKRVTLTADVDREQLLDAERRLEWREASERARELLERLKPDRRIVFLLVAVEGHTLAETAAILDLSLPAAKSRYLRARRDVDMLIAGTPSLCVLLGRAEARDE
ncbi:MAG: RNA polymerase sigma factor [Sandaracinaceae bacterium]